VREARTHHEIEAALRLRRRVFCVEQGVDPAADQDGLDDEALHVLALDGARVVGTCRLLVSDRVARLGRLAVEPDLRGHGAGTALLAEAERIARAAGADTVRLHAQLAALGLYRRAGYEPEGDVFLEEGIEHQTMYRALA
jgi:ElaA protein